MFVLNIKITQMENTTNQNLLNKQLQRHQILFDEFTQLRYDDKDFQNQYNEDEFYKWCKDYNLI